MNWYGHWKRERLLRRHRIPQMEFDDAAAGLPLLTGLAPEEREMLRDRASLLLADKHFSAAGGAEVERPVQLRIALQACLLTLHLDEASYRGWSEIILYPDEFLRPHEEIDEAGVVHISRDILAGESWHGGPLVLSIADVAASGRLEGYNVVLHEFAHKLDMLNGDANGFPPLHRGMKAADWARDFSTAYEDLCARVDAGEDTIVDPYASTSPAEFFAVATEMFFEVPDLLVDTYPAVYVQMQQFYRQDPLARLGRPT
ncbi:MAG: M90 family metallopeptidase [Pseudomonadota bacterium]